MDEDIFSIYSGSSDDDEQISHGSKGYVGDRSEQVIQVGMPKKPGGQVQEQAHHRVQVQERESKRARLGMLGGEEQEHKHTKVQPRMLDDQVQDQNGERKNAIDESIRRHSHGRNKV